MSIEFLNSTIDQGGVKVGASFSIQVKKMVNAEEFTDKLVQSMSVEQAALYERIQAFSLDKPDAQLSFSKRLARENRWSLPYAQQAIEEYKKFAFLAVAAGHPVTPSDQVDQVWHLHLTYTRSYWEEFCSQVLQTPLHHEPTRGGQTENQKFDDWYRKTLESYERFFGQFPPVEIWSVPSDRFGRDLHFQRVNFQQNWIIPKPVLKPVMQLKFNQLQIIPLLFMATLALSGCSVAAGSPNPLNFTGMQFLAFYICSAILVIILAIQLRFFLRTPSGRSLPPNVYLDLYETAYLVDGQSRVVETAIVSLVQKEVVTAKPSERKLTLQGSVTELSHSIERIVANAILLDGRLDKVKQCKIPPTIHEKLQQLNLLVSPTQASKVRHYPTLLIAMLFLLGIVKIFVGISRGRPVGFLVFLVIIVAIVAIFFWNLPQHRSRYGDLVVKSFQSRVHSKKVSATDSQLPLTFALWGVTVLPIEMYGDLKTILTPPNSGSSDGSGSGDSGGCVGGGCGGCGG